MDYLYVDNFRGFDDTLIALKDVNFLVGENSTGKTSLLSLITLIRDFSFWYTGDFNTEHVNLGYFNEIAPPHESRTFLVGWAMPSDPKSRDGGQSYYLLTFSNTENIPTLSELRVHLPSIDLAAKCTEAGHTYKHAPSSVNQSFEQWIHNDSLHSQPWKPLQLSASKRAPTPTIHSFMWLLNEIEELKETRPPMWLLFEPFRGRAVDWIAPIRAKPKRTYDSYKVSSTPEGDHAPYLLKDLLAVDKKTGKKGAFSTALLKFGRVSGLFNSVQIKPHGRGKTAPFEIYISFGGRSFKIANVGYGISQVLPILVDLFSSPQNTLFVIQQPEVHLHPKAQAALGGIIFDLASKQQKMFIIETHSDFLIDRFRLQMSQGSRSNISSQVLFCERRKSEPGNSVTSIPIDSSGQYSHDQPTGFRDFFIREQMNLLSL